MNLGHILNLPVLVPEEKKKGHTPWELKPEAFRRDRMKKPRSWKKAMAEGRSW